MNGQMIYNANGDQFIITELVHPSAYPSECGQCGDVLAWQTIQDREADMFVVIFALSLYKDDPTNDTAIVTCKGCALGVIANHFDQSSSGIANLRAALAGA